MNALEWLRVIVLGIVEGITEWLPISSTGHLILLNSFWKTGAPSVFTDAFTSMFDVVIQLGAILAVVTVFFDRINPFSSRKDRKQKKNIWDLWGKIIVGCIPAGIVGVLFDDWIDAHLMNAIVVAVMLIAVGFVFIAVEYYRRGHAPKIVRFSQMSLQTAFLIGVFQILSLVPGTSRSGITIIGGLCIGCSRHIAAEYTFYLAIPIMFGASLLKIVKYIGGGTGFTAPQFFVLLVGMAVAYAVSLVIIRFLMSYIRKHNFNAFALYRIALGIVVLILAALGIVTA